MITVALYLFVKLGEKGLVGCLSMNNRGCTRTQLLLTEKTHSAKSPWEWMGYYELVTFSAREEIVRLIPCREILVDGRRTHHSKRSRYRKEDIAM